MSTTPSNMFSVKSFEVRCFCPCIYVGFNLFSASTALGARNCPYSDISFHNLMLDGNNGIFDLASIMELGETSPPKMGHRRTGTSMFMSLELLTDAGVKGFVPRMYLESFAWFLCVANGEENLDVSPFRDWVGLTCRDVVPLDAKGMQT